MFFYYLKVLLVIVLWLSSTTIYSQNFQQKLDEISKQFIGKPYKKSPLGEGFGIDADPKISFDAFDCTTYIETVIAMSFSHKTSDYLPELNKIRYSQTPNNFENRRHFPVFQWLPELIKNGYLKDNTSQIGQENTHYLQREITTKIWQNHKIKSLKSLTEIPNKTIKLAYIPTNKFLSSLINIKKVAVLSLVKDQFIAITHQVLLIPTKNGFVVRHARSYPINKVVEEPVDKFIKRIAKHAEILGLNIAIITQFEGINDAG